MCAAMKTPVEDLFCPYLFEGATLDNNGIPVLARMDNIPIPSSMVPFDKMGTAISRGEIHQCLCGFCCDTKLRSMLFNADKHLESYKWFDSVTTPDLTIMDGRPPCIQQSVVCLTRAFGSYLQRNGIPVIPTVRWGDPSTYSFCFLGIPKRYIVAVSTLTCTGSREERMAFRHGLIAMLEELEPKIVLVYGSMPGDIFDSLPNLGSTTFRRYPSRKERAHQKRDDA